MGERAGGGRRSRKLVSLVVQLGGDWGGEIKRIPKEKTDAEDKNKARYLI